MSAFLPGSTQSSPGSSAKYSAFYLHPRASDELHMGRDFSGIGVPAAANDAALPLNSDKYNSPSHCALVTKGSKSSKKSLHRSNFIRRYSPPDSV